jgi:hypothetical protein
MSLIKAKEFFKIINIVKYYSFCGQNEYTKSSLILSVFMSL